MIIKQLLAHKEKAIVISLAYTIMLVYFCLKQSPVPIELPSQSDKLLHVLAYFVFTSVWFFAFIFSFKLTPKKSYSYVFLWSLVFGIIIEFLQQTLTNHRQADVLDVLANVFGTILALLFIKLVNKER